MALRKDPLAAAAEATVWMEQRCGAPTTAAGAAVQKAEYAAEGLVCTVGMFRVWPGASNVIPGSVTFTMDIRCWLTTGALWLLLVQQELHIAAGTGGSHCN